MSETTKLAERVSAVARVAADLGRTMIDLTADEAERIARLLAEDDERVERSQIRRRYFDASQSAGPSQNWPDELIDWGAAATGDRYTIAELRAFEAAYRAAVAQEQP